MDWRRVNIHYTAAALLKWANRPSEAGRNLVKNAPAFAANSAPLLNDLSGSKSLTAECAEVAEAMRNSDLRLLF
jgi:hypothetical protein